MNNESEAPINQNANVLKELVEQELIFHNPPQTISREYLENMLDESFWEVGASGRIYDRAHGITTLVDRLRNQPENNWETHNFKCFEIAKDNYLLTYTLAQETRLSRRASLWRHVNKSWKILYHQGTLVQEGKNSNS